MVFSPWQWEDRSFSVRDHRTGWKFPRGGGGRGGEAGAKERLLRTSEAGPGALAGDTLPALVKAPFSGVTDAAC